MSKKIGKKMGKKMSKKIKFNYMGDEGLHLLRLRQITTLHHVASKLKYDSDTLYMVQNYLLKIKYVPMSVDRVIKLRKSLDPKL
tara:strand:- start:716 stop:967 length:252 start_codon:yes stop_codon:yes gene_type:complete